MSDRALLEFGRAAAYMCTPYANLGQPPRKPQEKYILNLFLAGLNYEEIAEQVGGRQRSAIRSLIHVRARRAANQITKEREWTKISSNARNLYRGKPSLHIQTRSGLAAPAANG